MNTTYKQLGEIFTNWKEDSILQQDTVGMGWVDTQHISPLCLYPEDIANKEFRIKPSQQYRPYKDLSEIPLSTAYVVHKNSTDHSRMSVMEFKSRGIIFHENCFYTYEDCLERYQHIDGSPFGVKA